MRLLGGGTLVLAIAMLAGAAGADPVLRQVGKASIYADVFEGDRTASGERFRQEGLTAASRTLPLGSRIRVTNPETGRTVRLKVTDRGPFVKGRILDISEAAAKRLGIDQDEGVAPISIEALASDQPTPKLRRAISRRAAQKQDVRRRGLAESRAQASP